MNTQVDIFWFLLVFLCFTLGLAVSGGYNAAFGKHGVAVLYVAIASVGLIATAYLLYLDGLFYATGHPLTIQAIFFQ